MELFNMSQLGFEFSGKPEEIKEQPKPSKRIVVFDLETQKGADEVGGWNNTHLMRVAIGVAYDFTDDTYHVYRDEDVPNLLALLKSADLVIGFNSRKFDYGVLKGYTDEPLEKTLATFDILEEVQNRLNFRLKLDNIAMNTLGVSKSADGLQSLQWFKEGKLDLISDYCKQDVKVTRDVYIHGVNEGHLFYSDKMGRKIKFDVKFPSPE